MDLFQRFQIAFSGARLAAHQSGKELTPEVLRLCIETSFKIATKEKNNG